MSCNSKFGQKLTVSCSMALNVPSCRTGVEDHVVGSPMRFQWAEPVVRSCILLRSSCVSFHNAQAWIYEIVRDKTIDNGKRD
jgi:hypothetical protein